MEISKHTRSVRATPRAEPGQKHRGDARYRSVGIVARFPVAESYELRRSTHECQGPGFTALWRNLLQQSRSPASIYQTPEFFRFLTVTLPSSERLEVYSVLRKSDGAVVGVVPVRIHSKRLAFRLGPVRLVSARVKVITILGSVPLIAVGHQALVDLMDKLFARFPECAAVSLQTFPAGGDSWRQLEGATHGGAPYVKYIEGGLRECHTIPLPATFEQYLQKFSAKKRYNLGRQIRLLEKQRGPIELCRVEEPAQVPAFMRAIALLATAQERAGVLSAASFTLLAENGLLLSYVLHCGGEPVALVVGTGAGPSWHVHAIFCIDEHASLSIGTSVMHLSLQDLIGNFDFALADFGYGTPNQEFRSTHELETRAHVIVYPRRSRYRVLFRGHGGCEALSVVLVKAAKQMRKKVAALPQQFGTS